MPTPTVPDTVQGRYDFAMGNVSPAPMMHVNLRPEDEPPQADPWVAAKEAARIRGEIFSACAHLGIVASRTMLGDPFETERLRRQQDSAHQVQRDQHVVCLGCAVALPDGRHFAAGEAIAVEQIGQHGHEVIAELRSRGIVSSIDPGTAWLRSLPADVGPYVVVVDTWKAGDRTLRRGASVSAEMFPDPAPRITDAMSCADLTVGELRDLVAEQVRRSQPGYIPPPPPMGQFSAALASHIIERAPNYVAPVTAAAPKKKGLFQK